MELATISRVILVVSIGLYALHLFLVFRRIFRQTSYLRKDSANWTEQRFSENGGRLHKNVDSAFEFEEEPYHEETEEES